MYRPCTRCGEPHMGSGQCVDCRREADAHRSRASRQSRGYDAAWVRLSKRARRLQPFCTDCGAVDDLTVDHTPEAWARKAAGKAIRLEDVDVVCRRCNARRGRARPQGTYPQVRGTRTPPGSRDPRYTLELVQKTEADQ